MNSVVYVGCCRIFVLHLSYNDTTEPNLKTVLFRNFKNSILKNEENGRIMAFEYIVIYNIIM